jgi:hypothetical protein
VLVHYSSCSQESGYDVTAHRRPITDIAAEFLMVDFSQCTDNYDPLWGMYEAKYGSQEEFSEHRESADPLHIAERARSFFR